MRGAPGIRTLNLRIKSPLLCQVELAPRASLAEHGRVLAPPETEPGMEQSHFMTKHPKDPTEAIEALDIGAGSTVIAVGPDHGYVEALAEAVGKDGKVIVQAPPPDLEVPSGVDVVEAVSDDARAEHVIAWVGVVPVHAARATAKHVADDGAFWLVLPRVGREDRAPVTEGDLKRAMLSGGWKEERVQLLSHDSVAVRFRKRR
jgi:hypothetical protein